MDLRPRTVLINYKHVNSGGKMTDTTNKQTESLVAQPESDSNIMNKDNIEENGEDIASLEKQLAE